MYTCQYSRDPAGRFDLRTWPGNHLKKVYDSARKATEVNNVTLSWKVIFESFDGNCSWVLAAFL
jgi:hypothetical protein